MTPRNCVVLSYLGYKESALPKVGEAGNTMDLQRDNILKKSRLKKKYKIKVE